MLLLVGTSMIMQRLMMGLFWSNLFELGRNIRSGHFDFFLAQPGNPLFMVATRKLDLDGLLNVFVAVSVVVYAAAKLGVTPSLVHLAWYALLLGCGLMIQFGLLLIIVSLTFWVGGSQGLEGSYFTLFEFSRLPRQAFRGLANFVFVWALPVVLVSYVPAQTFLHGNDLRLTSWLVGVAAFWTLAGIFVFQRGLKRYSSASS
jgi:ABC-2 type transport system permease protein